MSLRKQLLLMILTVVLVSVSINSFISSSYIDTYFRGYIQSQYNQHIQKISSYGALVLTSGERPSKQTLSELERYLDDPIIQIGIFDSGGREVLSVSNERFNMHENMMRGRRFPTEQDQFEIKNGDQTIGYLAIVRNASLQSTESVMLFKSALRMGGMISGGIVLTFAVILAIWISRRLSADLRRTADYATSLQDGDASKIQFSRITEINAIQLRLRDLSAKLQLQTEVQKERADQLTHEARTPLTLLRTNLEGVMDGVIEMDESRLESCLHEIETLTKVLGNINQVLDHQNDQIQVKIERFNLVDDVKKIMKGMKLQFEQSQIELSLQAPHEVTVSTDRVLLSQILYNLLTNAYKFTPKGGNVTLSIISNENFAVSESIAAHTAEEGIQPQMIIQVEDSGPGIDPLTMDSLFLPYYRDPSVYHLPGEGLGLYIAKRNAEAIKSQISIANRPEGGAIVSLHLPLNF